MCEIELFRNLSILIDETSETKKQILASSAYRSNQTKQLTFPDD